MIRKDPQGWKKLYFKYHRQTTEWVSEWESSYATYKKWQKVSSSKIRVYPNLIFFIRRRRDDQQPTIIIIANNNRNILITLRLSEDFGWFSRMFSRVDESQWPILNLKNVFWWCLLCTWDCRTEMKNKFNRFSIPCLFGHIFRDEWREKYEKHRKKGGKIQKFPF